MLGIVTILGLVLSLLHLVGGLAAFIWLLLLGQWSTAGVGLFAVLVSPIIVRLALMPGLWLFGLPAALLRQASRHSLARMFYALIGANTVVVMGAWCLLWAWAFLSRAEPDTRIPLMLWAYAVGVGPWTRIARKSAQEEAEKARQEHRPPETPWAQIVTFLVQGAFICGGIVWLAGWTSFVMGALPLWTLALVLMASVSIRQQETPPSQGPRRMGRPGSATIEGEGAVSPHERDRHDG